MTARLEAVSRKLNQGHRYDIVAHIDLGVTTVTNIIAEVEAFNAAEAKDLAEATLAYYNERIA